MRLLYNYLQLLLGYGMTCLCRQLLNVECSSRNQGQITKSFASSFNLPCLRGTHIKPRKHCDKSTSFEQMHRFSKKGGKKTGRSVPPTREWRGEEELSWKSSTKSTTRSGGNSVFVKNMQKKQQGEDEKKSLTVSLPVTC